METNDRGEPHASKLTHVVYLVIGVVDDPTAPTEEVLDRAMEAFFDDRNHRDDEPTPFRNAQQVHVNECKCEACVNAMIVWMMQDVPRSKR